MQGSQPQDCNQVACFPAAGEQRIVSEDGSPESLKGPGQDAAGVFSLSCALFRAEVMGFSWPLCHRLARLPRHSEQSQGLLSQMKFWTTYRTASQILMTGSADEPLWMEARGKMEFMQVFQQGAPAGDETANKKENLNRGEKDTRVLLGPMASPQDVRKLHKHFDGASGGGGFSSEL